MNTKNSPARSFDLRPIFRFNAAVISGCDTVRIVADPRQTNNLASKLLFPSNFSCLDKETTIEKGPIARLNSDRPIWKLYFHIPIDTLTINDLQSISTP